MSKKLLIVVAAVAVSVAGLAGSASAFSHNQPKPRLVPQKVEMCHVNKWDTEHPYTKVSVNVVEYLAHYLSPSHNRKHVPTSPEVAQQLIDDGKFWGDIMPPFNGYLGLNLTDGQAILDNNCEYVVAVADPEPEVGGMGGGAVVTAAPVVAPTKKLVAAGGANSTKTLAVTLGLIVSVSALGYGALKLRKI